jgi:hypothetical protein
MIVLDAVLMVAITLAIVGFLTWTICTQDRHRGRARPLIIRPQINARRVTRDEPQTLTGSRNALPEKRSHSSSPAELT